METVRHECYTLLQYVRENTKQVIAPFEPPPDALVRAPLNISVMQFSQREKYV